MSPLALLLVLAASPVDAPPSLRVQVGGQVGFPFLLGVSSTATFFPAGRPRFDLEATWEPSVQLQSYSVAGAYHVLDSVFFVGPRLRLVQYQPPWARGPVELFFGAGLDAGVRIRVADGRGVLSFALHGTFVPGQATNLATLVGLSAGFSWSVFER